MTVSGVSTATSFCFVHNSYVRMTQPRGLIINKVDYRRIEGQIGSTKYTRDGKLIFLQNFK